MFPIFAGNSASTGYNLTRSLRTRASASAYLNRTLGTPTNNKIWTLNLWLKIGTIAGGGKIFSTNVANTPFSSFYYDTNANLTFYEYTGTNYVLTTTQVFRDPSAWYMFTIVMDTTQATASNRTKFYVNGTQITSFSSASYVPQNTNTTANSAVATFIGQQGNSGGYFDGYLAEVNFIDGQALTPSSFGSTNALTGVWQPARYTGTYGTNGFYLPFTDNSALTTSSNVGLGKDFSGNGNYWTTNNISITAGVTYDSMTDVPTLTSATASNFCVMNPLDKGSNVAISNGNLTLAPTSAPDCIRATFGLPSTGQWYWEVTVTAIGSGGNIGVATQSSSLTAGGALTGVLSQYTGYYSINSWSNNGSYTSWTTGDVIAVAVNTGTGAITFYKNGTSLGVIPTTLSSSSVYFPFIQGTNSTYNVNFGQRPFTYTPPTGFVALNTFNLPTSTIVKGNTVMDATLYTGTLLSNAITNAASFKPDLVWLKSRSAATSHKWTDSVRGVTIGLVSDSTAAETTDTQGLTAFNSNGFTVGTNTTYNNLAATYVAWQWQAGQGSTSSNTNGTITSTVSVNASAGFSVVTWTANGSANQTIGHGLGVTPSLVIVKHRNDTDNWAVWITGFSSSQFLRLNTTDSTATSAGFWNATPTSSVFSVGSTGTSINVSGGTYVAYCWTPIAGYSAFGSYTGNGSTDGTFVYTGFRPKFIMIKRSDSAGNNWRIWDTARATYNAGLPVLYPNASDAEDSVTDVYDLLSNGFKLRTSGGGINASGGTYIYMAYAENPLKNALAR
jgi:hypothetical protein